MTTEGNSAAGSSRVSKHTSDAEVLVRRVDEKHSNTLAAYKSKGSPQYPTQAQIEQLNRESALAAPELLTLRDGLDVPGEGLILLEMRKW